MIDQLNNTKVERLKSKATRYEIRDKGERGLILRIGKKGDKVWEVMVHRGKKRQRVRLGLFPDLDVPAARVAAADAKRNVNTPAANVKTVADLFEKYRAARADKMRAWHDVESVWRVWGVDRIGHIRLTDLSVHNGRELRDHVAKNSSEVRAGAVVRYLRPMFTWAADESLIDDNPWLGLKAGAVATPRDRVLSDVEWESLWGATFQVEGNLGPLVRALMLSAQRLSTVAQMRWAEIHGDMWTIPKERMKATRTDKAKAHEVPLSKALADVIARQPRIGEFVFTVNGATPYRVGSQQKVRIGKVAGITDWRLHDIRRSAATRMTIGNESNKVSRFIVERVLGHSDNSVTAVYDRASYRDEKREALEILATVTTNQFPKAVMNCEDYNENVEYSKR